MLCQCCVFGSSSSACDCGDWQYEILVEAHIYVIPRRFQWNRGSGPVPFLALTVPNRQCPCLCLCFAGNAQTMGCPEQLIEVGRKQEVMSLPVQMDDEIFSDATSRGAG